MCVTPRAHHSLQWRAVSLALDRDGNHLEGGGMRKAWLFYVSTILLCLRPGAFLTLSRVGERRNVSNPSHSPSARTPIAIPSTTKTTTSLWLLAQLTRAAPAASGSVATHPHTHHGVDVRVCECVCARVCKCYKLPVSEQYHILSMTRALSALPLPLSHPRRVSLRRLQASQPRTGASVLRWEVLVVYPSTLELQNRFLVCIYHILSLSSLTLAPSARARCPPARHEGRAANIGRRAKAKTDEWGPRCNEPCEPAHREAFASLGYGLCGDPYPACVSPDTAGRSPAICRCAAG